MNTTQYILGIETSCDDTSVAILENEKVLSCKTITNSKKLDQFGGIVPEIASRHHEQNILKALNLALLESKITINQITKIAFTKEPGLVGCLFVGEIFAKTLSQLLNVPYIEVNHIHGHILSPFINSQPTYPFLSLIASGKTTSIFIVKSVDDIVELNKTVDDAIGETFDKIGKALGYGYPAGPKIDQNFDIKKATLKFNYSPIESNFSYSGIKNHVLSLIHNKQKKNQEIDVVEIGSSFMKWAIDSLTKKLSHYSKVYSCDTICIGGGVASNSYFQSETKKIFKNSYVPEKQYATDNAAMIAYIAYLKK